MNYIRTYFECFKAAGMDTTLQLNRMRGNQTVEEIKFDHVTHDGVSLMLEMARRYPADGFVSPNIFVKPKPSLSKRLWELFKWYFRFYPFLAPVWKEFSKDKTTNANGMVEVENWKDDQAVSLNTRLLFALDKTGRDFISQPQKPRVWMTPVGLYTGIHRELEPMNRVSFIDVEIKNSSTLIDIQNDIKKQLSQLSYWGTLLTLYLPVLTGRKLFTAYGKIAHHTFRRTGTFTNLGAWTIPGLAQDEWWTFGQGAVAKMSPVSGAAIMVNGRLGLSIHFHPYIGLTDTEAQQFVERWKDNFLQM